jgi:hypothetical protein
MNQLRNHFLAISPSKPQKKYSQRRHHSRHVNDVEDEGISGFGTGHDAAASYDWLEVICWSGPGEKSVSDEGHGVTR